MALFSYPGGASNAVKKLLKYFPPHRVYVEPFVGGGSAFFAKDLAEVNVINDKDTAIIAIYDAARTGGLEKCADGFPVDRDLFDRSCKMQEKDPCAQLACRKLSYQGNRKNWMGDKTASTKSNGRVGGNLRRELERLVPKLQRATISNLDFEEVMRKWDGPDTFFFLDPPWYDLVYADKFYKEGDQNRELLERVAKVCGEMHGKVMVIYNMHPDVRRAFTDQGFTEFRVDIVRTAQAGVTVPVARYVACNWDPRTGV